MRTKTYLSGLIITLVLCLWFMYAGVLSAGTAVVAGVLGALVSVTIFDKEAR